MDRAMKFISLTMLLASLAIFACSTQEEPERGRKSQAIIECNGDSIGLACDTDDDPCTEEVCVQLGASVQCQLAQLALDGTPCLSDGLPCTADTCEVGVCQHTPLAVGTLCDDGLFCSVGETCNAAGNCLPAGERCDDGNPCTLNSCDELAKQCNTTIITVGAACNDGDACTQNTTCSSAGDCNAGSAIDCDDGSECTSTDCDPAIGCTYAPLEDSPCSDDFFCTIGELCTSFGSCEGVANCSDSNPCTTDSCDELAASCSNVITPAAGCNDGNPCTSADTCSVSGVCTGSPVANGTSCGSAGGCVAGGMCSNGTCVGGAIEPDGTSCDDNSLCTDGDVCNLGTCGGYPVNCSDGDRCTADGCDEATGCFNLPIAGCSPDSDAGVADAGLSDAAPPDSDAGLDAGTQGVLGGGGCQSSGRGSGLLGALMLLIALTLLRRRRSQAMALATLLALLLSFSPSSSQADGFDSELFKPATSSTSFLSQSDAEVLAAWRLNLGLSLNTASDPLVLHDPVSGEPLMDGVVVSRRSGAYLTAALGLPAHLELGLALPVLISQIGNAAVLEGARDVDTTSIGDPRVELKARLLRASVLRVGVALSTTIPFGDDSALFAESSATLHPRLLLAVHTGPLRVGVDLGLRIREETHISGLTIDDEITAGLGASVAVVPEALWLIAETYARRAVQNSSPESTPAEALLGARYRAFGPWQLLGAGGVGIGRGYGTPAFRALFSLQYAPSTKPASVEEALPVVVVVAEPEPEPPPAPVDSDGDGIFDPDDDCPDEPEDMDGFEDEDGCPDFDNDGDKIVDLEDDCPLEAEIINGINDEDGCPDEGIIVMIEDRIVLEEKVLFDLNRSRVKRQGRTALQAIITLFQQHPEWTSMRIEGHADSSGAADFNLQLSIRRAERVQAEMIKLGMDPTKISNKGFGETMPRVQGDSEEAMQKNRRVEFVVVNAHEEIRERVLVPGTENEPPTLQDNEAPSAESSDE